MNATHGLEQARAAPFKRWIFDVWITSSAQMQADVECRVRDISDSGAKVVVPDDMKLDGELKLFLNSGSRRVRALCRKWLWRQRR